MTAWMGRYYATQYRCAMASVATDVCIDQCFKSKTLETDTQCALYYFSDASEMAYGAVFCIKINDGSSALKASFIMDKSRLAPIKLITIPRLELCGAVLAARLHELIMKELTLTVHKVYFWCDSMTVLCYLRNTKSRFKTFSVASHSRNPQPS